MKRRKHRRRKTNLRIRKWFRNLVVLLVVVAGVGGVTLAVRSWRTDDYVSLQRARLAIDHGKPNTALDIVSNLIAINPKNVAALCTRAEARLALHQFDKARDSLERAIRFERNNTRARSLLVRWALMHALETVRRPEFVHNTRLQSQFDAALAVGYAQVAWYAHHSHKDHALQSRLTHAKLLAADIERLKKLSKSAATPYYSGKEKPQPETIAEAVESSEPGADPTSRLAQRYGDLEDQLLAIFDLDPAHLEAWTMYVMLLLERRDGPALWRAAEKVARISNLPARLASHLATGLLTIPGQVLPPARRIATARKLMQAVGPDQKTSPAWSLGMARVYLFAGDAMRAQPLLETVLRSQSHHLEARYLLSKAFFDQGAYRNARTSLEELRLLPPPSAQTELLLALTQIRLGDIPSAFDALTRAKKIAPTNEAVRIALLDLMAKHGRLDEMRQEVEDYYRSDPAAVSAIRLRLKLLHQRGDQAGARSLLNHVASLPTITDDHRLLAVDGFLSIGDYKAAAGFAQDLVERHPDRIEGSLGLAASWLGRGQPGRALAVLAAAAHRFDNNSRLLELMGRAYLADGRFQPAAEVWQSVLENDPKNDGVRLLLAEAYLHFGLAADAVDLINQTLANNPSHPRAHRLIVRAYEATGEPEKARQVLSNLNTDRFDKARHPELLARVYLARGETDEAKAILQRALDRGHTGPQTRQLLARLAEAEGDPDQAAIHLKAIVLTNPKTLDPYLRLAELFSRYGLVDKGLVTFRTLENINALHSRLAQGVLLRRSGRTDASQKVLRGLLQDLVIRQDKLALRVADELSTIHFERGDYEAAVAVYDSLIRSRVNPAQAALRQADLALASQHARQSLERLDTSYAQYLGNDRLTRFEYMQRYAAMGRHDRALTLLEEWIERKPDLISLRKAKAELLAEAGRIQEAVQLYLEIRESDGESVLVLRRLAQLQEASFDFPAAEGTLKTLARIGGDAEALALVDLADLYARIGLKREAGVVLNELAKLPKPLDASALLTMGRTLSTLDRYSEAESSFQAIPSEAAEYAYAQVNLASIEQRRGENEAARDRVTGIFKRSPASVASALINLPMDNETRKLFFEWSDEIVASRSTAGTKRSAQYSGMTTWPASVASRWLGVRVAQAARRDDWNTVMESLDALASVSVADTTQTDLARICVRWHLGDVKTARELYRANTMLHIDYYAELLQALLVKPAYTTNDPAAGAGRLVSDEHVTNTVSIARCLTALLRGDYEGAKRSARDMSRSGLHPKGPGGSPQPWDTVFATDILSHIDSISGLPNTDHIHQQLALAFLSRTARLPELCALLCKSLRKQSGAPSLAHALYAQAILDQPNTENRNDKLFDVRTTASGTALALYLDARLRAQRKDYVGAAQSLTKLSSAAPSNRNVKHALAQAMVRTGRHAEAIAVLEKLGAGRAYPTPVSANGAMSLADPSPVDADSLGAHAANDLAYMLARHAPHRLNEAFAIASQALQHAPHSMPLRDTIGWIQHLRGQNDEALKHLSIAVASPHAAREVHYHIGAVYQALGRKRWAKYHLDKAASGPEKSTAKIKGDRVPYDQSRTQASSFPSM